MEKVKKNSCKHDNWKPQYVVEDPLDGEDTYVLMICVECYERKRWVIAREIADPLNTLTSEE